MADTIIDTPEGIAFARLAALKGAVKLEAMGMRRSRGPSALSIAKREYGLKGNAASVAEQLDRMVKEVLGK